MDRNKFINQQMEALEKALNKSQMPLKPKHARTLIVGTHTEKSSALFWHAIGKFQLENHPTISWKFCQLVHKLLRDGYRTVPEQAYGQDKRFKQLGEFWKHLNTSGYGVCINAYCKTLKGRIVFHHKYPVMNGKLELSDSQMKTIYGNPDDLFEITVDMLDEMENLLNLQDNVFEMMHSLRWSSLTQDGQMMLSPMIIVILDTSKFYDHLVKMIFKLHSIVPPDVLDGHRSRFNSIFRRTKKFYEEASNLQYFKYLVSIPTLPANAPNFLQQSDLESYRTPHAYLKNEGPEEVAEDVLLNFEEPTSSATPQTAQVSPPQVDRRDEQIIALQQAYEDERLKKERLGQEARNRIEQYENRLAQMQAEIENSKREMEDHKNEVNRLSNELAELNQSRIQSDDAQVKAAEEKTKYFEDRCNKMREIYDKFRAEHVNKLTQLAELQKTLNEQEASKQAKEDEITALTRKLEEAIRESSRHEAKGDQLEETKAKLLAAELDANELRRELEQLEAKSRLQLVQSTDSHEEELRLQVTNFNGQVGAAVGAMLDKCEEDLHNATSIQFPPHLAQESTTALLGQLQNLSIDDQKSRIFVSHCVSNVLTAAAAAAYTSSITHYDEVNEQCKKTLQVARASLVQGAPLLSLNQAVEKLNSLLIALPLNTDIDKNAIGNELESEMARMDEIIKKAVQEIEALQRKAKESSDGIRLEVNESILGECQKLMSAIMALIVSSRDLQNEIVASGKGTASPSEFYKRNHQWTEGLLSAAKAVGVGASVLVSSANGVVNGTGKFEHLIVAAQEIAASTAQLYVSSRVKADRNSEKLAKLSAASTAVKQTTAQVVATVHSGKSTLNENVSLDFSNLSLHDAKKQEMDSLVRQLELQQELDKERERLGALRKQHYHMAQLVAKEHEANGTTG